MGKRMKAGKSLTKPTYTRDEVKELLKSAEESANRELKKYVKEMTEDVERYKDVTYHNCDLWEQVILFVALKRAKNYSSEEMAEIGMTAQEISNSLVLNTETFDELKTELSSIGYDISDELWSWKTDEE